MTFKRTARVLCFMALAVACAFGQSTTGSLQGTVTDPGDAAVPGVQIELKNNATGAIATTSTGAEGIFVFNSLAPATYTLTVKPATGFKTYTQTAIAVTSNEKRDLGRIALALGALTEQVSVTAAATPVQTASSENTRLIDSNQFSGITLKGRDLFGLLVTVPGMNVGQGDTTRESLPGNAINGGLSGGSGTGGSGTSNFAVDGITDMDTGSNGTLHYEPNIDSIAELRVLSSNYQAEYGRNSTGFAVVTKGGSQEFHGSAYASQRSLYRLSWTTPRISLQM